MAGDPGLPGGDDVIAKLRRPGDADLRDQQAVLADADVVADLHEIIDLGPFPDYRLAEGGAIDRAIRADLHVIFDADRSDLRNLVVPPALGRESEAVRSDHHAAVRMHLLPILQP